MQALFPTQSDIPNEVNSLLYFLKNTFAYMQNMPFTGIWSLSSELHVDRSHTLKHLLELHLALFQCCKGLCEIFDTVRLLKKRVRVMFIN